MAINELEENKNAQCVKKKATTSEHVQLINEPYVYIQIINCVWQLYSCNHLQYNCITKHYIRN